MKLSEYFRLIRRPTLASGRIIVGDASGDPADVAVTGDVTISNAGVTAIGSGKVTEAMQVLADNTTANVTTSAHGYVPKAPNDTTKYLRGDASWAVPAGGGGTPQTYIAGLVVTQSSTTAIAISAGEAWVPAANAVVTYAGGTNSPSLGASQKYSVYLNSDGSIEVQNEDPPSSAYMGTARKRATGNAGRFIGWFLTNGSSQIYSMTAAEAGHGAVKTFFNVDTTASPFRCLNAGTQTTLTSVSLAGAVPRYCAVEIFSTLSITSAGTMYYSLDGTNNLGQLAATGPTYAQISFWVPIIQSTPNVYYKVLGGTTAYIDVAGFTLTR